MNQCLHVRKTIFKHFSTNRLFSPKCSQQESSHLFPFKSIRQKINSLKSHILKKTKKKKKKMWPTSASASEILSKHEQHFCSRFLMWAFPGLILCPRYIGYNWLSTVESVRASEPSCRDSNPGVPDYLLSMFPRFINSPAAYNLSGQQRLNNVD